MEELKDLGELDLHSLTSSEPRVVKEQIRQVFLFSYALALRPENDGLRLDC